MRVAVYSGSFNPLHIGHLAIIERLTRDEGFDAVYLVVSPTSPFKQGQSAPSGQRRYRAAIEAVRRHPGLNVKVDDIELTLPPPQYTIRTLDALKAREPGNEFTLVVGGDQLEAFGRWKDYSRILLEYGLVAFPRRGFDNESLRNAYLSENPSYRIKLCRMDMVDVSSSDIRERLSRGEDVSELLM